MNPELAHLVALDRLDRAIEQSDRTVQEMRDSLVAAEESIAECERFAAALQDQLGTSRDTQHAAERKAKRYRDRLASAQSVLDSGVGDYSAAERQIAECNRILDELETEILEQMEQQDDLVQRIRIAESDTARARAHLVVQRERAPEVFQSERDLRAGLETERGEHIATLEPELVDRYQRLCSRKKRAVAPVDQDTCAACMHTLKPQQRIELTRERMVTCDSCHRWLYVPEA